MPFDALSQSMKSNSSCHAVPSNSELQRSDATGCTHTCRSMLDNHNVVASNAELESLDAKPCVNTKFMSSGQNKFVSNADWSCPGPRPCESTLRSCNSGSGSSKYSGVTLSTTDDCSDSSSQENQHVSEAGVSHGVNVGGILKYLACHRTKQSAVSNCCSDSALTPNAKMASPGGTPHANSLDFILTRRPNVESQSPKATPRIFDNRNSPHILLAANEASTVPCKSKDPTSKYSMSRTRIDHWVDCVDTPRSCNSERGSSKCADDSDSVNDFNQNVSESTESHGMHPGTPKQPTRSGVHGSLIVKNTFLDLKDQQSETEVARRNACARSASADGVLNCYRRGAPMEPHSFFLGFKCTSKSMKLTSSSHAVISNSDLQTSDATGRTHICHSMLDNHDVVASNADLESPDTTPRAKSTFISGGQNKIISNAELANCDTTPCENADYSKSRTKIILLAALGDTKTKNHQNGITPSLKSHDVDGGFMASANNPGIMSMMARRPPCVEKGQNELQPGPVKPCNANDQKQVKLRLWGLLPSRPSNRPSHPKLDAPTRDATTLVIQGIPQVVCQSTLMSLLDQAGLKFKYDFFLLPSHGNNKVNVGWAIVNLVDLQSAKLLKSSFDGLPLTPDSSSTSTCKVLPAAIQGLPSLWKRFGNTAVNVGSDGPVFPNLVLPISGMSTLCSWFGDGVGAAKGKGQGREHEDTSRSSMSLSAYRSGKQTEIKQKFSCSLAGVGEVTGKGEEAKEREGAWHADAMMSNKFVELKLHDFL